MRLEDDGYTLDDLDAKTLQGWNMLWHVGEQTNLANPEIGEDLSAETNVAEDALVGSAEALGTGAIGVVDAELRRLFGAVDGEAELGVMQIHEGSATSPGDLTERGIDGCAAVAGG